MVLWQEMYGVIPHIQGKGKAAAQVSDILSRMQREQPRPPPASVCQAFWGGSIPSGDLTHLFVFVIYVY